MRSPIYGRRFPIHREPLQWSCYNDIPALSKREIVESGHQSFFADYGDVERGLADRRFEYENTSGTTSAPMTVIMEDGWWAAQTRRAYRASPILREFTDRPHRREPRENTPMAVKNTHRVPYRSAIHPLIGMNTARLSV